MMYLDLYAITPCTHKKEGTVGVAAGSKVHSCISAVPCSTLHMYAATLSASYYLGHVLLASMSKKNFE